MKENKKSPVWLTIYSDLMTNLMLFFLMLYGITRMSVEVKSSLLESIVAHFKNPEKQKIVLQAFEKSSDELKKFMADIKKQSAVEDVLSEKRGYRILLKAPVVFYSASARLRSDTAGVLSGLADFLKKIPNTIEIAGHTDDVPVAGTKWKSNWELSLARAESVRKFLIKCGINPAKICIAGYGDTRPVFPNDSAEHRRYNRRIEVIVLNEIPK
ncbi:MAG: flagellar motor protein MotB [Elusimicrobia bacterium]|nr:flagellar motor protein MotB [Elusimicrobiota bacterium]